MADACASCRFWSVYTPASGYYDDIHPGTIGECRRRAPLISDELLRRSLPGPGMDQFDRLANDLYVPSAFPVTERGTWCGEFEASRMTPRPIGVRTWRHSLFRKI